MGQAKDSEDDGDRPCAEHRGGSRGSRRACRWKAELSEVRRGVPRQVQSAHDEGVCEKCGTALIQRQDDKRRPSEGASKSTESRQPSHRLLQGEGQASGHRWLRRHRQGVLRDGQGRHQA